MTVEQKARYQGLKEQKDRGEQLSEEDFAWMAAYRRQVAGALRGHEQRSATAKYGYVAKGLPKVVGGYNTVPNQIHHRSG